MKISEEIQVPLSVPEALRRFLYDTLRLIARTLNSKADRVSTDHLVFDDATKGVVLKDTQATPHYWRVTVSNVGALIVTDLGTTRP